MYLPLAQHMGAINAMSLIVRSSADPALVAESLQGVVASLDSETPVSRISAVEDIMAQAVSRPRFTTVLVLGFAAIGVVLGEMGAVLLMSSLSSQLFGVGPWDSVTYAAVPVLLIVFAVVAAWLPARRATALDPVAVLRAE